MDGAFQYIAKEPHGLETETEYPYTAQDVSHTLATVPLSYSGRKSYVSHGTPTLKSYVSYE